MVRPAFDEWLRRFIAHVRKETRVPAIAIAVRADGRRWYACAGAAADGAPLTEHHRFHLGCATKLLLGAVTLELSMRSELDLAAPLGGVLHELASSPHGEIRIAHLLSHTSGYRGTDLGDAAVRNLSWSGLVELLRRSPRHFPPGQTFSYEHSEAVLLAEILLRITGRTGLDLVQELVFAPLGIVPAEIVTSHGDALDAGRHEIDAQGHFAPIGTAPQVPALWAPAFSRFAISVADLTTIAEALCTHGPDAPRCAVSAGALELLHRPVVTLPPGTGGPLSELLPTAFGLGAARLRGDFVGGSGLTHGQCLGVRFDPATGLAVSVGLNATVPHLRDLVLTAVCREVTGRPAAAEVPPLGFMLEPLVGRYRGPGRSLAEITCADDRLICALGREDSAERLRAELALDDQGRCVLRTPIPQLSIGFFRETDARIGLMIGLHAYKRVA
jgi:CubicO group peptidase (beta-lactamase class C family)